MTSVVAPQTPNAQNLLAGLPSRFEPNMGQAADGIAFTLKAKGYLASLSASGIHFALPEGKSPENPEDRLRDRGRESASARAVVTMSFPGANPDPAIVALDPQPGVSNYFLGNDPGKWQTNVPGYSKIYYKDLYPGIDMVIYDDHGQVRYDFVVAPGADTGQIEIAFEGVGADNLTISDSGDLIVESLYGDLTHKAPFSYQGATEIESSFEIQGDRAGFRLGAYDHTRELTIDPSLAYSSYLGGSSTDSATSIAVDSTGNAHVTGRTAAVDFPTASAIQAASGGSNDSFISKFNSSGSALLYSTYLGGSNQDYGLGLALDSAGNAYVCGLTESSDFPLAVPFQASNAGGLDAFVTKINATGSALTYSTYLGGTATDTSYSIAVNDSGNAYVTGQTNSASFPTASPLQGAMSGPSDAFVTVFNSAGSALAYSTYLGGSGGDVSHGVAVDSSGSAYVTGSTTSADFPTSSPVQGTYSGGGDAFVAKVNSSGSSLVYSTYLGGTGSDEGRGIAVDTSSESVVSGFTDSTDFPTYSAFQPFYGGGAGDAFVTRLVSAGTSIAYSTYLGGSASELATSVALDQSGNAHVVGSTYSPDFPTEDPYQATNAGNSDAFFTAFDSVDSMLLYSTYVGGTGSDDAEGVAVDSTGVVHIAGSTDSTDFPLQSQYQGDQGSNDAFVLRHPPPVVNISGIFTGGTWGSISVYSKVTGEAVAYMCCITDSSGYWSIKVPPSNCAAGRGYAILFLPPDTSSQARWYNDKPNFTSANCVRGPSAGNSMTISSAGLISGYVKDAATAADISGASVYAFKADGTFARGVSTDANGRYELNLSPSETYKLLVNPGASHVNQWYSGAQGFTEATAQAVPSTANFSVTPAGVISGYVKDAATAADLNGYPVYAFTSAGTFFAYGVTDRGFGPGRYRINVNPGESYRLKSTGGSYATQWFSGASSFSAATDNVAPFTANFSLT